MNEKPILKSSGKEQSFSTGAVRDTAEGKRLWHLVSPFLLKTIPPQGIITCGNVLEAMASVADFQVTAEKQHLIKAFTKLDGNYEDMIAWLEAGALRYEARNWEQGIPISRCIDSLWRHLIAVQQHRTDEDHKAAAKCNIMFIYHYLCVIETETMAPEINDLPKYTKK